MPNLKIFFYILFIFISLAWRAQNIDSLKLALKNTKDDTTKCNILSYLANNTSEQEWPGHNQELNKLAESKLKDIKPGDPLQNFYLKHFAATLGNIGFIEINSGNNAKAIDYIERALKIQEEIGAGSDMSSSLSNLASIYNDQGNIAKSLEYSAKNLKWAESANNKASIASALSFLAIVYRGQGDNKKALEYMNKCLKIQEERGNKIGIANAYTSVGVLYKAIGNIPKALECYLKGLKLAEEINEINVIATTLGNIGVIYDYQGNIGLAREYVNKSLKIYEERGDKKGVAFALNNLGVFSTKEKKYKEALENCLRSLELSKEIGYVEVIKRSAEQLNIIYKKLGNYQKALENYELFILMRDSITNVTNKKTAIRSQLQYEYDKKEIEIMALSKADKEKIELKAEENSKRQRLIIYSVISGLFIVTIFSFFIFRSLRQNKKKNIIITHQKDLVDEKQKEILDSILYAKRIQTALLPHDKYITRTLEKLTKL